MTVGIENKKQNHVSPPATGDRTDVFTSLPWEPMTRDRSQKNNVLHSGVGENRTHNENHLGAMAKPKYQTCANFSSRLKKNSKTEEAFRRQLPNTFKYWNIHKKKRDSSSPSPFFLFFFPNYTGYDKQVINFLYLTTETLAGDVTKTSRLDASAIHSSVRELSVGGLARELRWEEQFPNVKSPAISRFLNSALTLWAFCLPFPKNPKTKHELLSLQDGFVIWKLRRN